MAPTHCWTVEQRLALHLINSQFPFDDNTKVFVFKQLFNREVTAPALASQYRDRNRADRAHLWNQVLNIPSTASEIAKRQEMYERIQAVKSHTVSSNGSSTPRSGNAFTSVANGEVERVSRLQPRRRLKGRESPASQPSLSIFSPRSAFASAEQRSLDGDNSKENSMLHGDSLAAAEACKQPPFLSDSHSRNQGSQLEMIHHHQVVWDGNQAYWDPEGGGELSADSTVYQHGAMVHNVTISIDQSIDYMICDPTFCPTCGPNRNLSIRSKTGGFPFVHSTDVWVRGGTIVYQPTSKPHVGDLPHGFIRPVRFQSRGALVCQAMICDMRVCRTCRNDHRNKSND